MTAAWWDGTEPVVIVSAPPTRGARRPRCGCGRPVALPTDPVGGNGVQCANCDDPAAEARPIAPSDPATPGGVFGVLR